MYRFILIFCLICSFSYAAKIDIKAIIGDEVITSYDIEERIKLISLTSNIDFQNQNLPALKNQVREVLISESLQIQETKKYKVTASEEQVNQALESIIKSNGLPKKEFISLLEKRNIDIDTFKKQIKVSLSWQNFILYKIKPLIQISDYEIANYYLLYDNVEDVFEYLANIAIFPILDNNISNHIVFKIFDKISKNKISFIDATKNFSYSKEEKIWRNINDFPKSVRSILQNLDVAQISEPIRGGSNYYLINLEERRLLNNNSSKEQIANKLFMQKLQKKIASYMKGLRHNYVIERKS
jgi:peptidyl-prolyl cis-trans isomerase SurA